MLKGVTEMEFQGKLYKILWMFIDYMNGCEADGCINLKKILCLKNKVRLPYNHSYGMTELSETSF
jgi:hypothetical protein